MSLINSGNWEHRIKSILEGQLIEGTVTRLTKYGAFVSLKDGLEGFIHVSEIAENRIEHPKELLHEGDVLTLRIIKINSEQHRIGLSIRQVDSSKYADLDWKYLEEVLGELETQDTNEENENEEKRMYLEKNSIWRKKGEADDNDEDSYFDYYGDELEDDSGDYND